FPPYPPALSTSRLFPYTTLFRSTSMAVTFSFKAFFDGIGKTQVHMVASVIMNVLNVALCVTFIFDKFGAPHMGMAGAGMAGAISDRKSTRLNSSHQINSYSVFCL